MRPPSSFLAPSSSNGHHSSQLSPLHQPVVLMQSLFTSAEAICCISRRSHASCRPRRGNSVTAKETLSESQLDPRCREICLLHVFWVPVPSAMLPYCITDTTFSGIPISSPSTVSLKERMFLASETQSVARFGSYRYGGNKPQLHRVLFGSFAARAMELS